MGVVFKPVLEGAARGDRFKARRRWPNMIRACSVCASTELRMPGFGDGIVPETDNLAEYVCHRGHRMTPLEFEVDADYVAFRDGLKP